MQSPFPGMDPYLEDIDLWQGFHNAFMVYLSDVIQPLLPDNSVARLRVREYYEPESAIEYPPDMEVPDLEAIRTRSSVEEPGTGGMHSSAQSVWLEGSPLENREAFVEITTVPNGNSITSIELLSPNNKRPGPGRHYYLSRQAEVYNGGINLVEIDLLRQGMHTAVPSPYRLAKLRPFHYLACVYRQHEPLKYQVFTWTVRDPLPKIPIPLGRDEPELEVDLQALLEKEYRNGAYWKFLDYKRDPHPPLVGSDAKWADARLKETGVKGSASA